MPKGMAAVAMVRVGDQLLTRCRSAAQSPPAGQSPAAEDADHRRAVGRRPGSREAQSRRARRSERWQRSPEAAGTYTDIVDLSLAERADAVRLHIASARGDLARLRPMMNDEAWPAREPAHRDGDGV